MHALAFSGLLGTMKRLCAPPLVAIALVALLAACGSDDKGTPAGAGAHDGRPATASDLESHDWQLRSYALSGSDDLTAAATSPPATAKFADSKVSGSTGCNNYNGTYSLTNDGAITFGDMASTKAYCEQLADQEAAMLKAFDDAKTAEVAGTDLQFLGSKGDVLMVFGSAGS
jgi:heat shock protein HslJ